MNLATIQKILKIQEIPDAENIELAFVLGWQVVVKKGEFKIGDLAVYIQIDTVVPDKPEFEFLKSRNFRVRTIKLRKQLSQGILFPLSILPNKSINPNLGSKLEGVDVTEILEIKKYEKPDNNPFQEYERKPKNGYQKWVYLFKRNILYKLLPSLRPKLRSPFPKELVPITDEERIQNIPNVLETHKGKSFVVSYKLDGSSITIIHNKFLLKHRFRICSRRFELHDKNNDWYKVFKSTKFDKHIIKLVNHFNTNNIIVQGEAIGKFNGNHHGLTHNEIRLFNIYVDGERLSQSYFAEICLVLDIPHCPLYKIETLNHTMESILEISKIPDVLNPKAPAEGLVWRCVEDNLSFKVINNNYLLTEK